MTHASDLQRSGKESSVPISLAMSIHAVIRLSPRSNGPNYEMCVIRTSTCIQLQSLFNLPFLYSCYVQQRIKLLLQQFIVIQYKMGMISGKSGHGPPFFTCKFALQPSRSSYTSTLAMQFQQSKL